MATAQTKWLTPVLLFIHAQGHRPMFSWDDMRYFIEVARLRKISQAATKLNVTHTTVARRIQALERHLKTRLFERTPVGHVVTASGEQLMKFAEDMEASSVAAAELVMERDTVLTGTVRLGVPEGLGSQFIAPRLAEFYSTSPGIDLQMVAGTQLLSISKREADLAITLARPNIGRLIARKLTDYTLRLYGARRYLQDQEKIRVVADLSRCHLIGYIDDLIYAPQLRYLDEILPNARVRIQTSSINAQIMAVKAGLGLGILPCFMADADEELEVVLSGEIEIKRSFWLSMHEDLRNIRRVSSVWDWLATLMTTERSAMLGLIANQQRCAA